jgi:RNA polymerase sigma factor (sigma-70 family)
MNNPRTARLFPPGMTTSAAWAHGGLPYRVLPKPAGELGRHAASLVTDEALFTANLPVIDDVTTQVCRRHRLSAADAEDFRSDVRIHFLDRNCEVLRKFEGRSSLTTYITVVIQRLFLDRRNRLWGKWRPSAEARRLGPTAMLLERLVSRDGWSLEQALESLRVNQGLSIDDTLREFSERLSKRMPTRQMVEEAEALGVAGSWQAADANVVRAEHDFLAKRVQTALDRARQGLTPEEQLILKMRFDDRVPVADIARALNLNQRRLYRTLERILAQIGASMAGEGVSRAEVQALFAGNFLGGLDDRDVAADGGIGPLASRAGREKATWPPQ